MALVITLIAHFFDLKNIEHVVIEEKHIPIVGE
jgi:hypothetical protein